MVPGKIDILEKMNIFNSVIVKSDENLEGKVKKK